MINSIIYKVEDGVNYYLTDKRIEKLRITLKYALSDYVIKEIETDIEDIQSTNEELIKAFKLAKRIEGLSQNTINSYVQEIHHYATFINGKLRNSTTDDIRRYLNERQTSGITNSSLDTIRRKLSSFYSWLEEEDYVVKSPLRRIHKIKTIKKIKQAFSAETIELLRDNCTNERDVAIIDFLISSGVRVGELVKLKIEDVDLTTYECIVLGKGGKQRKVYFDPKTKVHLERYLKTITDDNPFLFVNKKNPFATLTVSAIEKFVNKFGKKANVSNVHPHRFRRTVATITIDKGMPIEQVQHLLGHTQIDTTLHYVIVDETNVKNSHEKFLR